ncbi:AfsR/SARP family transcriptional regulator [Micromonospora peucetia]|uniref:DNA-binding transcriptional activator of the SARP family n=1 Tax=Micromonospora peucetia TaxID=47871 RepID=A0A1C6UWJ5_9ACTN|nr:BTAD domain-containing putative transcriptional regulator [Micromonospora peucetia]SCL58233.1 DNA-binding transcriptional activator of the SARP family [Micromonospora peucetia]
MRFQVLGPFRVQLDRGEIPLAASREQRVLAALLLDANRVVPMSRLVEAIWDEHPPTSSVKVVRNCVSMLRRRLVTAGEIGTESGGYVLRVPGDDIDLRVFADRAQHGRRLAAAGELAGAVVHLREALALWRGPAFTGVTGRLIEAAAAQLNDQRRSLQEERLSHELTLGGGVELVDEIADLVAAEPLRERAHGQLMLALYRAGRRTEALRAYHQVRRLLVGELGIEPGQELAELHRAILKADPRLAPVTAPTAISRPEPSRPAAPTPARPVPAQLPASPHAFTGRTAELDGLCGLLDAAARAGTAMVAVVSGIAGVGKTALAVHFARLVVDRFPDGQLHVDLRGFYPTGPPVDPGEAVRGFLAAFGVPAQQLPEGLAAQSALLRTLLAERRVLLVLDNARDSTHVRPLLPGGPGCLTLITSRSRLTGLVTTEGAHPITLDPLPLGDAHRMLIRRLGAARLTADPAAVTTITARSAGLPLALAIVASRMVSHPHFSLRAIAEELELAHGGLEGFTGMDAETDVRSVFSWSYRALSGPAARLFRLLSMHPGPDLGAVAAASLAGVPPSRVRPLLAELAYAHMVTEHTPGRYAMHDLLRAYAVERTDIEEDSAERPAVTHRMFDHYLGSAHLADLRLHPHRDPIRLPAAVLGVTVAVIGDREAARAWFSQEYPVLLNLLRRAGSDGHDVHAWQLGWAMTTFLDRRGHWHDQAIVQQLALEAANRVRDRDGQARAHRNISIAHLRRGLHGEARDHLWHAVRLYRGLGDQVGQARTLLNLGTVAEHRSQPRLALRYAEQALRLFRAAGHRSGQANALNNAGWYHSQLGNHELALHHCQRALALHQEAGNRYWQAHTWDSLGCAYHHLGRYSEATECYRQALSLWREAGERYYESATLTHLGDTHLAEGERSAARGVWREALDIVVELGQDAGRILDKIRTVTTG